MSVASEHCPLFLDLREGDKIRVRHIFDDPLRTTVLSSTSAFCFSNASFKASTFRLMSTLSNFKVDTSYIRVVIDPCQSFCGTVAIFPFSGFDFPGREMSRFRLMVLCFLVLRPSIVLRWEERAP